MCVPLGCLQRARRWRLPDGVCLSCAQLLAELSGGTASPSRQPRAGRRANTTASPTKPAVASEIAGQVKPNHETLIDHEPIELQPGSHALVKAEPNVRSSQVCVTLCASSHFGIHSPITHRPRQLYKRRAWGLLMTCCSRSAHVKPRKAMPVLH